jgi:chromosome segregation ATPase
MKMKKTMMTIAAVSVLATAAPAFAQYRGQNLDNRIENLQSQLQQGVQRGTISRNEAQPLRERLRQLTRLERQYSRGGFSRSEQNDLQRRIQTLRQQIQHASRDGRYDRDGRDGRDGRDDHRGYDGRNGR